MKCDKRELLVKSTQPLPPIPVWWRTTTAPVAPAPLPARVELSVTEEMMQIHAKGITEQHEDVDVQFPKHDIVGVAITLMRADTALGHNDRWSPYALGGPETVSSATVRHLDPLGVEPYFESRFTSHRAYWLKALAKALKEHLGIEPTVRIEAEEPPEDLPF
jgi:hypothetical protein